MPDKMLWERQLPRNTGFALDMKAGQSLRVTSQTIIDFVCFNRENLRDVLIALAVATGLAWVVAVFEGCAVNAPPPLAPMTAQLVRAQEAP